MAMPELVAHIVTATQRDSQTRLNERRSADIGALWDLIVIAQI